MAKWTETDLAALKANPNIRIHEMHEQEIKRREGKASNHANRGVPLQKLVEMANQQYEEMGRAVIWGTDAEVKYLPGGKIVPKKSTVDFIGCLKGGRSIAFDCKSTQTPTLPAKNVPEHQVDFLMKHSKIGGLSFLMIGYMKHGRYFVVDICEYYPFWVDRKGLKIQDAVRIGREVRRGETCLDYL